MITTTTTSTAITTTTTIEALYRLLAWLSPAYPVGAYTYSHGLETAVEDGAVRGRDDLVAYVSAALTEGAGRVDGALLAAAHRAMTKGDARALDATTELGAAWRGTAETALEAEAQGTAFLSVTLSAWPEPRLAAFAARHPRRIPHAVAFGAAAAAHGIPLREAAFGFLSAFAANLVSAGVRLVPLGQTDGQVATASMLPVASAAADAALAADLDRLGTAAVALDIFSIRHETQYTRLFRS
ncbi:urease accessory protein UreF [Roseomonas sp. PWR1]|uniref:Urease accessory protein UreF n=1 Tax=Roseomonas nitratireducens TaxID=2820810 RepID=A0ABS4AN93_9PROT|nr:urease accessory UreF family protein [Neoroseomonas nitratireducens]MBP0462827.1 urease accessory protein UreF [Neoroseomonas nitratireducens]